MEPFVINRRMDFSRTRLIDSKGNFHKSIGIGDAKQMAGEYGLSLVCFSLPSKEKMALCKIVDYGRKHYIRTPLNLTFTNLVKAISHKKSNSKNEKQKTTESILDL